MPNDRAETVEDVIAEMREPHQKDPTNVAQSLEPFYSQLDLDDYAARLTAALERERARQMTCDCWREEVRPALLKVADEVYEIGALLKTPPPRDFYRLAKELRRIAGRE